MSSVEEATLERVSESHASKSEKEVPASVKEKDEIGDAFDPDGSLTRKSGPPGFVVEGEGNFIAEAQGEKIDEDVNNGNSANSRPILVKEAKVSDSDSPPEGNGADGEIGKLTIKDDSPVEDSTEGEAHISPGQGTILNGILSLVGLGSSKTAVAEDGHSDSTAALNATDRGGESEGLPGAQKDSKESESSEFKEPQDSKDAGPDEFELLDVKSGDSMDNHGQSISTHASEFEVPSQATVASKLVDSEPVGKQIAANDRQSEKLADAAENGEISHGQHEVDVTESSSMRSTDDKATIVPEATKTEEVAPISKTGLLELVGGGVLSLIGLGGAKHAAETPEENENERQVDGETRQCNEAGTEISKHEATFELVDKPSNDDFKYGGPTETDNLLAVDAADDDESNAGQVAVGETPKSTSDGNSVETVDGADQETSSIVSNSGGYPGNEISLKESAADDGKHVDIPKDVEESMVAAGSAEGDPRRLEVRNDSEDAGAAEKAIEGELEDLRIRQTDSGEAGEAGKIQSDSHGNQKYCSPDLGRSNPRSVAAADSDECGGPGEAGVSVQTDSNQNGADKTNQQEENVHRKAVFGDNGELEASKTILQSPKIDDEETGRDSDVLNAERHHLPSEANFAQEPTEEVRMESEERVLADINSSEAIHTKAFLADQDQPLGPEVMQDGPVEDETFEIADSSRAEGTESRSKQEPNVDGVAEVVKEQGTKDAKLNGHVEDSAQSGDSDNRTDNFRPPLLSRDEAVFKAASQPASDFQGEPDPLKKVDKGMDDEQSMTSNASNVLAQEHPAIDRSDSKTRSIFGVTLKRVESINRTSAREVDSPTKDEVLIGKGTDRIEDSSNSREQTSSISDAVDTANPNMMDDSAALNGYAGHAEQIHPREPDDNKEQDALEATQQQHEKEDSSKDEPNAIGTMVSEDASQERKFEPTPFSAVKDAIKPISPSLPLADTAIAQTDLETDADTITGASNVSLNEVPSSKENGIGEQAGKTSSNLAHQADMHIYAPKHEDEMGSTTPQSLNESRSTTPPETPFAQRPEHLEQKHPPSPADDQSASQSPIASTLPVSVQTREWSAPGEQSREVAAKTSSSEPVKATNAFVKQTTPETYETYTSEKEASAPTSGKPTVKRSRSKSGVAIGKLKVCFTGCSSVEK